MIPLMNIARAAALAGLVSGCIALSAPAFAADNDTPPSGAVAVNGTDFTSPRAVAHLKGRVRRVAMDICVPNSGGRIPMSLDEQRCYQTAVKDGFSQIASRHEQALLGHDHAVQLAATRASANAAD